MKRTLTHIVSTAVLAGLASGAIAKGKPAEPDPLTFENAFQPNACYQTVPGTTGFDGTEYSRDTEGYIVCDTTLCLDAATDVVDSNGRKVSVTTKGKNKDPDCPAYIPTDGALPGYITIIQKNKGYPNVSIDALLVEAREDVAITGVPGYENGLCPGNEWSILVEYVHPKTIDTNNPLSDVNDFLAHQVRNADTGTVISGGYGTNVEPYTFCAPGNSNVRVQAERTIQDYNSTATIEFGNEGNYVTEYFGMLPPRIVGLDLDGNGTADVFDNNGDGVLDHIIDIDCTFPIPYKHTIIVDPVDNYTAFGNNLPQNMVLSPGELLITYDPDCSDAGQSFLPQFYVSGPPGSSEWITAQYRVQ